MKKTANIQTAEGRKELAAKTAAAIAAKKAEQDAAKDMELEEKKIAEAQKPAAEQKENKRQAEFAAIAADLLKKTKINIGAARTDKKDVRTGDIIAFHANGEYLQVWKISMMTSDKSIFLTLQCEDALHQNPDTVGAWTFEDWRINGLRNVFASRKNSRDKFIRVAIFAGV